MTEQSSIDADRQFQRRGRITAIILMSVVALPMLIAYVLYHTGVGIPDGQVNQGDLLSPPQSFVDWQPMTLDGEPWDQDPEKKRWRYVIPIAADCPQQCRDNLYLTRQVHVRLGDKAYRVERIILPVEGRPSVELQAYLEEEHPGTDILLPDSEAMMTALKQTNFSDKPMDAGRYFLMDQEGYVMMAYTPEHTGNQLLKDIKRLLRYSYDD